MSLGNDTHLYSAVNVHGAVVDGYVELLPTTRVVWIMATDLAGERLVSVACPDDFLLLLVVLELVEDRLKLSQLGLLVAAGDLVGFGKADQWTTKLL